MRLSSLVAGLGLTAVVFVAASPAEAFVAAGRHRASVHPHRTSGLVSLVGDRESGLGFYPLPRAYRTHGLVRGGRGDAIHYAIDTEAGRNFYRIGEGTYQSYRHGVFNPVDGYGTPFFAGYYGPAGDPDEERGPLGRPYD